MAVAPGTTESQPQEISTPNGAGFKRVRWWVTFLLLAGLSSIWALTTPLFGGPDEQSHSIRAAAVARGELTGETRSGQPEWLLYVTVPGYLESSWEVGCFAFKPDVPADCFELHGANEPIEVPTTAGKHPPFYYLLAGLPLRLVGPLTGLYLMRLMGVLIFAALVTSSLDSLGRLASPRIARVGLLLSLTPMVLFVSGIVNPSVLEIGGAIGLWSSGAVLLAGLNGKAEVDGRLIARVGVAASVLVLSRALAPFWAGLILTALLAMASRRAVVTLFHSWKVRAWALVVVAATSFQMGWLLVVRPLDFQSEDAYLGSLFDSLLISFGKTYGMFVQFIGNFGYLDTPSPPATVILWTMAWGALVALGLAFASRRRAVVLAAVAAAVVLVPLALEVYQAPNSGFVWQGRYTLPLVVGVPILAAVGISMGDLGNRVSRSAFVPLAGSVFVVGHLVAYLQHFRRNAVGFNGPLAFWRQPDWSPPVNALVLIIAYTVFLVLLTIVALRIGTLEDNNTDQDAGEGGTDRRPGYSGDHARSA